MCKLYHLIKYALICINAQKINLIYNDPLSVFCMFCFHQSLCCGSKIVQNQK